MSALIGSVAYAQRGFAVPANSSGVEGQRRDGEEPKGQGRVPQGDQHQFHQSQNNKRVIILAELTPPINTEDLKRAVAERLASINQGECVDVRKPPGGRTFGVTLELDTPESAQLLIDNGLSFGGRQVSDWG